PAVRPYRDYIAWLQQQELSKAEIFWRERLKGFTTPTSLTIINRNLSDELDYDRQYWQIPTTLTSALQSLAKQYRLTLNTVVQGAWAILLSRYSGEADVSFGITTSGRPAAMIEVESMIGIFINTLPLRVNIDNAEILSNWLQQLQEQQVEIRQYEYSPLVDVQGWSELPRGTPLFESVLVFENYPMNAFSQEQQRGFTISNVQTFEKGNYPIAVMAVLDQGLLFKIGYDCHRFDRATINRIARHLQTLLENIVADPKQYIPQLPMLTETERYQMLVEWNTTKADGATAKSITELFEIQAERSPQAVAIVFEQQQLTYCELNCQANQLARYLQKLGVGPEVLVGIYMERSIEMIVGLLGILKAGGAYLSLDPSYPNDRLAFMLADAGLKLILTQHQSINELTDQTIQTICLDLVWNDILAESEDNFVSGVLADNLAYAIYTSGSTGRPKGVLVEHCGLANLIQAQAHAFNLQSDNRILQFASLSFDAAIFEIVMALCLGSRLYLSRRETLLPGSDLIKLLREQAITNITLPPSALAALPITDLPTLHTIVAAGEACSKELVARWADGRQFFNCYGPTETTVWATFAECID
ncbi:MAG: AMP-binding protein, partial [Acidobacteriota bacterium]